MPNTYDVNLISEETGEKMARALQASAEAIMKIGNKMGAYDLPRSWQELQMHIQSGTVRQICPVGTKLLVDKESGVSATVHGSITGATVNEDTFIEAIGHSGTAAYEFIYDGSAWHLHGEDAELANYGIAVTGTPAADDTVVVHVQASKIEFDVVDIDYDVPVNDALEHTLALWTSDLLLYGSIPFCPAQKLVHVASRIRKKSGCCWRSLQAAESGTHPWDSIRAEDTTKDKSQQGRSSHTMRPIVSSNKDSSAQKEAVEHHSERQRRQIRRTRQKQN